MICKRKCLVPVCVEMNERERDSSVLQLPPRADVGLLSVRFKFCLVSLAGY